MFQRMLLDRRLDNPTGCLQKLSDNDSCIRIEEASWLVYHLGVCLGAGAKEKREFLIFRDTSCFHLPCFSCVTNTATIILLGNTNTVRYLSFHYLICDFYEGLDGKGGRGYKCQFSLKMSVIYQFSGRFQAICQLSVKWLLVTNLTS